MSILFQNNILARCKSIRNLSDSFQEYPGLARCAASLCGNFVLSADEMNWSFDLEFEFDCLLL